MPNDPPFYNVQTNVRVSLPLKGRCSLTILLLLLVALLAYANGANDNSKGVATLRQVRWKKVTEILLSWLITLPAAAALAAIAKLLIR